MGFGSSSLSPILESLEMRLSPAGFTHQTQEGRFAFASKFGFIFFGSLGLNSFSVAVGISIFFFLQMN